MAIQNGSGDLRIDADDLQLTHRGKTIAVKVRVLDVPYVIGAIKRPEGKWDGGPLLCDETFANTGITPETEVAKHGSAREWVRQIVLPRLQAWLDELYPASGTAPTAIEQIAAEVAGLRLRVLANGTVKAELL
jgi:hypothetical protein